LERNKVSLLDGTEKSPTQRTNPQSITENATESIKLSDRLAGDKSAASFGRAFGRETGSDDAKEAEEIAAFEAANPTDMTGTQFIFSPDQVACENKKADQGVESDGLSMSTAGKTTDHTRL
jgi:hypothetical protein